MDRGCYTTQNKETMWSLGACLCSGFWDDSKPQEKESKSSPALTQTGCAKFSEQANNVQVESLGVEYTAFKTPAHRNGKCHLRSVVLYRKDTQVCCCIPGPLGWLLDQPLQAAWPYGVCHGATVTSLSKFKANTWIQGVTKYALDWPIDLGFSQPTHYTRTKVEW